MFGNSLMQNMLGCEDGLDSYLSLYWQIWPLECLSLSVFLANGNVPLTVQSMYVCTTAHTALVPASPHPVLFEWAYLLFLLKFRLFQPLAGKSGTKNKWMKLEWTCVSYNSRLFIDLKKIPIASVFCFTFYLKAPLDSSCPATSCLFVAGSSCKW